MKIRTLVVDDSSFIRRILNDLLRDVDEVEVVGFAKNGLEAIDCVNRLKPEVVILDVEMPEMDGITALKHIMTQRPTPVVMFSSLTRNGAKVSFEALRYGALDFVSKPSGAYRESIHAQAGRLVSRLKLATNVQVSALRRISAPTLQQEDTSTIIICEDCGKKNQISGILAPGSKVICGYCNSVIPVLTPERVGVGKRISCLSASEGGYAAILSIAPFVQALKDGAILLEISDSAEIVKLFARYLDDITLPKVVFVEDETELELRTARIYVVEAGTHSFSKGNGTLQPGDGLVESLSSAFKENFSYGVLSGVYANQDAVRAVLDHGGKLIVQDPKSCLYREAPAEALRLGGSAVLLQNASEIASTLSSDLG